VTSGNKTLVLCADDYGYSSAVDQGILDLVRRDRLTGLSCLVQPSRWPKAAAMLHDFGVPEQADVGLHLNLTESLGPDVWCRPLPSLIRSAYLGYLVPGALPLVLIRDSLRRQFDAFSEQFGRPPDHVDGHQHVHQLPFIRDLLFETLDEFGWRPWLRVTGPVIPSGRAGPDRKARIIAALGSRWLARRSRRAGFAADPAFGGVYGFDADQADYLALLDRWLSAAPDGGLLMCHPAVDSVPPAPTDPIGSARRIEYQTLGSDAFGECLAERGVTLIRGSRRYAAV